MILFIMMTVDFEICLRFFGDFSQYEHKNMTEMQTEKQTYRVPMLAVIFYSYPIPFYIESIKRNRTI